MSETSSAPRQFSNCAAAVEEWLSSPDSTAAVRSAFGDAMASEGGGSHGRNISFDVLVEVCTAAVARLPAGLAEVLPAPDAKFVRRAVTATLPDVDRAGIRDEETLATAVQVVLLNLAAAVDLLNAAVAPADDA